MHRYTLDGTTYYVAGDRMYEPLDEEHGLEEIDDHNVHLYGDDGPYREYLVRLEWGGSTFSQVKVVPLDEGGPPKQYVRAEDFDGAIPVEAVIPDGVHECPECGSWAGKKEKDPTCFECGFGIESEESAKTEEA